MSSTTFSNEQAEYAENLSLESQSESTAGKITLVSQEGKEFSIPRYMAYFSSTLEAMLTGPRNGDTVIHLPLIPADIMEIICKYFEHKALYLHTDPKEVPEFNFPDEQIYHVMLAANFLGC